MSSDLITLRDPELARNPLSTMTPHARSTTETPTADQERLFQQLTGAG